MDTIQIDRGSDVSIQQQLYERLRGAIIEGGVRSGERLPSTRSLAAQLNIARGTVDRVYVRLADEGWVVARGQRGTVVSPELQQGRSRVRTRKHEPAPAASARLHSFDGPVLPFRFGLPALDLFPRKVWARLAARQARNFSASQLFYPDPIGLPALREALTTYLAVSRGIACRPEQVIVTTGYQAALNLVANLLLQRGDRVWLEDPGYGYTQDALRALSMRIEPIPVDAQGLCVDYGRAHHPQASLAVVTPTHQFPMGCSMSLSRRQALLAWAEERDARVLEDDYDCEFHYSGHRPPALKSIDGADRVFYAGSFSKSLFPGLRLGYLVLPLRFVEPVARICRSLHRGAAVHEQSVVAAFMSEGHFARHLRKMRNQYRLRRQALVDALNQRFGSAIEISLEAGGLHILARFPGAGPDVELAAKALKHGLMPYPLSAQSIEHDAGQGLLMSFTNIAERDAAGVAATLHRAITQAAAS
ncbi:MAG: PLP-dependent aminotransferase family protein [Lysobacter sp.]